MKKNLPLGPIAIMTAAFLWSLDGLLRRSVYVLSPLIVVFYEHAIGFILLIPFLIHYRSHIRTISTKTWGAFVWISALSSIGGALLYTAALGKIQFIQFSVVVLLQQLQPAFELFFGWILLREMVSKKAVGWFLLSLVGAYFVTFPHLSIQFTASQGTLIAALLSIGAAFSWGSSTAFSRYALLQMPSQLATGIRFGLATALSFILIVLSGQTALLYKVNESHLLVFTAIALSTGMVALSIYYMGLKRTPVWISSICELMWPVSAVAIDYGIFGKSLTQTQWIGAALIIIGMLQVTRYASSRGSSVISN